MDVLEISKENTPTTCILEITDNDGTIRKIGYQKLAGKNPGVVFIPGFMGTKDQLKPSIIMNFCHQQGIQFIRYDPTGLGESCNVYDRKNAKFSHWVDDARQIILQLTDGPQIIIGGSMGSWISLHLIQEIPEKFKSLLLTSPAINFGEDMKQRLINRAPQLIPELEKGYVVEHVHPDYPDYGFMPLSFTLTDSMIPYKLNMEPNTIKTDCPIRIIHGMDDTDIDYKKSLTVISAVTSQDAQLIYVKNAKHELIEDHSLNSILKHLKYLLDL